MRGVCVQLYRRGLQQENQMDTIARTQFGFITLVGYGIYEE
jgi:hypothetical protein